MKQVIHSFSSQFFKSIYSGKIGNQIQGRHKRGNDSDESEREGANKGYRTLLAEQKGLTKEERVRQEGRHLDSVPL